ncbi:sentan-like [Conger conger]|uniref:sentan-like n=1 Tax=Conger conger TaxID=82655 RepID=UPI002A5A5400|nr:sentan-like [Conger conger]
MGGSTSSSGKGDQPEPDFTSKKTPKSVPISKQLSSIKALARGSALEKAVATALLVFYNSAGPDGKVSKGDARELLLTQFQTFMQGQESKPKYRETMADLMENQDKRIAMEDFMLFLLGLTVSSDLLTEIQGARMQ